MRIGIPTQLAMLRSMLAGLEGDVATAIEQARFAGELVPAGLPAAFEATLRGDAVVLLASALARAGDSDGAIDAYDASLPLLRAGGNVMAVGRAIADLSSIAIARGDPADAVRLCESELARHDGGASASETASVWAALARARAELGQAELADAAARHALELANRAGDIPGARSAQATLAGIAPLLDGGGASSRPSAQTGQDHPVESLTEREIEVLCLVALGRSNSQVASELFVTVGTVKSHLHTISGKLGAANRVEAVARGRKLGLLD